MNRKTGTQNSFIDNFRYGLWFYVRVLFVLVVIVILSDAARAADIKRLAGTGSPSIIMVIGQIQLGDADRFAAVAAGSGFTVVTMASPGGSLIEGLRIGQMIRIRGFATLVPDGAKCASACAFAWLGGYKRFLQPNGRVGFHAAYIIQDGKAVESGVGNALAGAYLGQLGLGPEAILYITMAHPQEITWLTEEDAKRVGIEVAVLPSSERLPPPVREAAPAKPAPRGVSDVASTFPGTYFAHWSERGADTIGYFAKVYVGKVSFYGAAVSAEQVLDQKRKFAQRFPVRVYSVRPRSVSAECQGVSCTLTGVVDWDVRTADGREWSRGAANFELGVRVAGEVVTIISESGSVIEREASPPRAQAR